MKISSASKKVLASALSAAMVVAFAPTVAFAAEATARVTIETHTSTGKTIAYECSYFDVTGGNTGLETALAAVASDSTKIPVVTGTDDKGKDIEGAITLGASPKIYVDSSDTTGSSLSVDKVTVTMLADQGKAVSYDANNTAITLDLNGHTLTNYKDQDKANEVTVSNNSDGAVADTLTVTGSKTVTIDGAGTISAFDKLGEDGKLFKYTTSDTDTSTVNSDADAVKGNVTVKSATLGDVDGALTVAKKGTATAGSASSVTLGEGAAATTGAVAGNATVGKSASLTVEAKGGKKDTTVKGIGGKLTVANSSVVKVTASAVADDATVYGVEGGLSIDNVKDADVVVDASASGADAEVTGLKLDAATAVGKYTEGSTSNTYGSVLSISATATGIENSGDAVIAKAIDSNSRNLTVKGGKVTAKAEASDADAEAYGITGAVTVQDKGDAEVSGLVAGDWDANKDGNKAVSAGTVTAANGGKFTGNATLGTLTGGSYTVKPVKGTNYDDNAYELADDGTYWTVKQFAGYALQGTTVTAAPGVSNETFPASSDELSAIYTAVANALNGKDGAASFAFEKDQSLDTLKAQTKAKGGLSVYYSYVKYNAKKATDEQKAAYDTLVAKAAENKTVVGDVYFPSVFVGYKADGSSTASKLAEVTDFGTSTSGRETAKNVVTFAKKSDSEIKAEGYGMITYANGTASALEATVDSRDKSTPNHFAVTGMPTAIAATAVNISDITKPDTPAAAEKDTQGIDVAKKSKTVKLAKKASKTKKAQSFNMGVSAETTVTTAKKSGSKYVTVKGGKVTLKKGVKKGTYTAKVSVKAAASDQYLAAATTVTVKFVVKK